MLIRADVRFGSKADMRSTPVHVRFVPIADIASFDHFVGTGKH
jgi:hypothetical protein